MDFPEGSESKPAEKSTGRPVVVEWKEMSNSSKFVVTNAEDMVDKYGSDTVRMLLLSGATPASEMKWSEDGYVRLRNLQLRLLKLVSLCVTLERERLPHLEEFRLQQIGEQMSKARNQFLKVSSELAFCLLIANASNVVI